MFENAAEIIVVFTKFYSFRQDLEYECMIDATNPNFDAMEIDE
jgi:hypothetical protein